MTERMPESLYLAESMANSLDVETGKDDYDSAEKAEAWLAAHDLGDHRLSHDDLRRLRAFRAGLRALLLANHGEPVDEQAVAAMNEAAARAPITVCFDELGVPCFETTIGHGLDGVFARVLVGIATAAADGTWERLKICRNDTCAVAFYDLSKNLSRSWCSMDVCGNRVKVRTYRTRHARDA
jgi:predicted RNA-binding Zn ribbon-like protein